MSLMLFFSRAGPTDVVPNGAGEEAAAASVGEVMQGTGWQKDAMERQQNMRGIGWEK